MKEKAEDSRADVRMTNQCRAEKMKEEQNPKLKSSSINIPKSQVQLFNLLFSLKAEYPLDLWSVWFFHNIFFSDNTLRSLSQ